MKNRRLLAMVIIIIALLILAVIVYFLFFYSFGKDLDVLRGDNNEIEQEDALPEIKTQVVKKIEKREEKSFEAPKNKEVTQANLIKMASSFAERFGSYSNHSNYENVTDLKVFMTKKMVRWADNFIKEAREENDYSDIYQGVVTKAVSSEVTKLDENSGIAEILIKTQKRTSSGSRNNFSTENQNITITFKKEDGAWKVDSAYWQ